jgi:hypothetical protein
VIASVLAGLLLAVAIYVAFLRPGPITGDLGLVRGNRPGLRVLFIGNSFTARNSMIAMMRKLGEGVPHGDPIFSVAYAPGGSTLENAVDDRRLTNLLEREPWNDVLLQEQSQIPSRPGTREALMFPAATRLDRMAKRVGARTILFMTWGYEHGDRDALPADTYQAMQTRLVEGYMELSGRLRGALIAPVGLAWEDAIATQPSLDLWAADGRHPSKKGSYLAACVFYTLLSHRDATGSNFTAGLPRDQARSLQDIAQRSVRQLYYLPPPS